MTLRIFRSIVPSALLLTAVVVAYMSIIGVAAADDTPFIYEEHPIKLLQPIDPAVTELAPEAGILVAGTYFNMVWPWVLGIAAGIAVLQALYGGIQIMMSGGKEWKEEGKTRLMWALAGLLMIGLSGMILETLNPIFYNQV